MTEQILQFFEVSKQNLKFASKFAWYLLTVGAESSSVEFQFSICPESVFRDLEALCRVLSRNQPRELPLGIQGGPSLGKSIRL